MRKYSEIIIYTSINDPQCIFTISYGHYSNDEENSRGWNWNRRGSQIIVTVRRRNRPFMLFNYECEAKYKDEMKLIRAAVKDWSSLPIFSSCLSTQQQNNTTPPTIEDRLMQWGSRQRFFLPGVYMPRNYDDLRRRLIWG